MEELSNDNHINRANGISNNKRRFLFNGHQPVTIRSGIGSFHAAGQICSSEMEWMDGESFNWHNHVVVLSWVRLGFPIDNLQTYLWGQPSLLSHGYFNVIWPVPGLNPNNRELLEITSKLKLIVWLDAPECLTRVSYSSFNDPGAGNSHTNDRFDVSSKYKGRKCSKWFDFDFFLIENEVVILFIWQALKLHNSIYI